jgi:hypothetical protein
MLLLTIKKQPCWRGLLSRIDHDLYRTNTGEQIHMGTLGSDFVTFLGGATPRVGVLGSAA